MYPKVAYFSKIADICTTALPWTPKQQNSILIKAT
jgi:hypothetical protein